MKLRFLFTLLALSATNLYAQVGIGTTTPKAFFNVAYNKDVLFGLDVTGSGAKLLWYPSKTAFRVGSIDGDQWDDSQVGTRSFGIGYNALANNANTFAIGFRVTASGYNSTALGNNVSTDDKFGSVIIGDFGGYVYKSTAKDQMTMRFSGGYNLYTSSGDPQGSAVGVKLNSNGNAWQTLSDSTRKENYRSVNGASFLQKIARMRLGSWNYKGQDVKQYRHYGPMAQEFFTAFGHDELGTIGEDKSINQADFDGVNLIAIQALISEVNQLKAENVILRKQAVSLDQLRTENKDLQQAAASLRSDIDAIKQQLSSQASLSVKPQ